MDQFTKLTKYLPLLENDAIGPRFADCGNNRTPEHPERTPFVDFSDMVHSFIEDVYDFHENNKEFGLTRYCDILEQNGLALDTESMRSADVSAFDAPCILALIFGAVRAERFCDDALPAFFENGIIRSWLTRLKEIDDTHTEDE